MIKIEMLTVVGHSKRAEAYLHENIVHLAPAFCALEQRPLIYLNLIFLFLNNNDNHNTIPTSGHLLQFKMK